MKDLLPKLDTSRPTHVQKHPLDFNPHILSQPSTLPVFHDENEYAYFSIFRDRTSRELSGYFESDVWNRLILQVCHEESFARHAVVAIGALTKTNDITCGSRKPMARSAGAPHYDYALQQYGKALRLMQDIYQQDKLTHLRNILVSSLLTTCFESYVGNQETAISQAQAGVDVLAEYQDKPILGYTKGFLGNDLLCTFARLDSQTLMFKDKRTTDRWENTWKKVSPCLGPFLLNLPPIFDSAKEARVYWDLILEAAMIWRAASLPEHFSTLDFGENNIRESLWKTDNSSQKIQNELHQYTVTNEQWFKSFQPFFERSRAQRGSKDFLGASILMIKYLSSRIAVPRLVQPCDTYEDDSLPNYITIVDLARGLLEAEHKNQPPARPMFIFDDSLVAGLFLVATRCRDSIVRRQAIDLLQRYPRREGLWDSSMAAKVATWFMEAEEEGLEGNSIPARARLRIVKIDFVLAERRAVVKCSRIAIGSEVTDILPEVTLTW